MMATLPRKYRLISPTPSFAHPFSSIEYSNPSTYLPTYLKNISGWKIFERYYCFWKKLKWLFILCSSPAIILYFFLKIRVGYVTTTNFTESFPDVLVCSLGHVPGLSCRNDQVGNLKFWTLLSWLWINDSLPHPTLHSCQSPNGAATILSDGLRF